MRKSFLTLFFAFLFQIINAQVTNSVLNTGDWYKFSVDTTGVFKIDKNLLQRIGISTNSLNPKKIHIYGNGGAMLPVLNSDDRYDDLKENAIFIEGENDGSFDNSDYILFYAKGPHDWDVNTVNDNINHQQNIYSDEAYYFITVNDVDGKRIQQKTAVTTTSTLNITTFNDYTFYEKDEINLIAAGTQWFFNDDFNIDNTQEFKIPFSNALENSNIRVNVRGVSTSSSPSSMAIMVNGANASALSFSGATTNTSAITREASTSILNFADVITISITYNNNGNPSARAFLDYIEIIGQKNLIANGNQFSFRSFEQANTTGTVNYQIENNLNIFQIWDVSDPLSPEIIQNESSGNNFTFKDN